MANSTEIDRFIDGISHQGFPDAFNPWADHCRLDVLGKTDAAKAKRMRLRQHLSGEDVRLVLVGEAPGYQGCRYSGIPFTSEKLLMEGVIPRVMMPRARITTRELPFSEPSARVVWGALYACDMAEHTVLWNAYPWHPMKPGEPLTNRTPTPKEINSGLEILQSLKALYPSAQMVAVGRQAEKAMSLIGVKAATLRHPSMGGAEKFRSGLRELVESMRR